MEGGQSSNSGNSSLIPISAQADSSLPSRRETWKSKIAEATAYIEEYLKNEELAPSVKDILGRLQSKTQQARDSVMDVLNDSAIDKSLLLGSRERSRENLKFYDTLIVETKGLIEMQEEKLQDKAKLYLEQTLITVRDASSAGPSQRGSDEGFVDRNYFLLSDEERYDDQNKVESYANAMLRINDVMRVLHQSYLDALGMSVVLIGKDFGLKCLEESSRFTDINIINDFKTAYEEAEKLFKNSMSIHQKEWKEAAKLFQIPVTSINSPYLVLKWVVIASVMAHDYCSTLISWVLELEHEVAQKYKESNDVFKEDLNLLRQIDNLHLA